MDRRSERVLLLLLLLAFILLISRMRGNSPSSATSRLSRPAIFHYGNSREQPIQLEHLEPANATLGFGSIIAVSKDGSLRRDGLLLAANITEIDVTIPSQPQWTDSDLQRLYADEESWLSRGSAMAWLGHLNALRWFLNTDHDTALIFEDDVDWDIHLRTLQIPATAASMRRLINAKMGVSGPVDYIPELNNYWGNTSAWDIIYLGHCGDIFKASAWTDNVARIHYPDETVLRYPALHPYTARFLETINIPSGSRVVHQAIFPLCTYGFAVTRNAAYRLLHEIANREPNGGKMAYDVRVLEGCRDYGLRCWSANPELFHHMEVDSMIEDIDFGPDVSKPAVGADKSGRLKPLRGGSTTNLACPIRNKYFFTQDPETLKFLRDEVGRKGQCLTDIMEQDVSRVADYEPDVFDIPADWQDPRLDD